MVRGTKPTKIDTRIRQYMWDVYPNFCLPKVSQRFLTEKRSGACSGNARLQKKLRLTLSHHFPLKIIHPPKLPSPSQSSLFLFLARRKSI